MISLKMYTIEELKGSLNNEEEYFIVIKNESTKELFSYSGFLSFHWIEIDENGEETGSTVSYSNVTDSDYSVGHILNCDDTTLVLSVSFDGFPQDRIAFLCRSETFFDYSLIS